MKTKTIIGLVLTVIVVAGLVWTVPPSKVWEHLRGTDPLYLALACLLNFATVALKARRWQVLIAYRRHIAFADAFRMLTVGLAVNSVVPLRAGEALRSYALASGWNIGKRESVSTVLVDRSFDAISFGLVLLIMGQVLELPAVLAGKTYGWGITSLALVISLPLFGWLGKSVKDQPRERFSSDLQHKIALKLEPLSRGYSALTTGAALRCLAHSLLSWVVQVGVALLAARSLGIALPTGGVVLAVLAVNLVGVFPLTPANVGVFQFAFLFALSAYGVDRMSSVAVATVYQAAIVIPVIVVGMVFANQRNRGMIRQSADPGSQKAELEDA